MAPFQPLPFQPDMTVRPEVTGFFDEASNTISYLVRDPGSKACAVIDPVLDIDYAAGRIGHDSADRILDAIRSADLELQWIIETHVHADHISAASYLRSRTGARIGIGANVTLVQDIFGELFGEGAEFRRDGSQFDRLFRDGDRYEIGGMVARAMDTPGHTPACMTHVIGDAAFVADTLFMPDGGTARADFRGASARTLFRSIQRILSLPDRTRIFVCHDYGPGGREIRYETTVFEQRSSNIHLRGGVTEDEFVALREARDRTLPMPRLILPSLQCNIRAGELPPKAPDGKTYLKVPIGVL